MGFSEILQLQKQWTHTTHMTHTTWTHTTENIGTSFDTLKHIGTLALPKTHGTLGETQEVFVGLHSP